MRVRIQVTIENPVRTSCRTSPAALWLFAREELQPTDETVPGLLAARQDSISYRCEASRTADRITVYLFQGRAPAVTHVFDPVSMLRQCLWAWRCFFASFPEAVPMLCMAQAKQKALPYTPSTGIHDECTALQFLLTRLLKFHVQHEQLSSGTKLNQRRRRLDQRITFMPTRRTGKAGPPATAHI